MIMITKRNGNQEPYDPDKIKNSLAMSSDEAGRPLNESALNDIVSEISRILSEKTTACTRDIYIITTGSLYIRGLHKVLEAYVGYKKK